MKELKLRKTTHNGLKCYKDENKLYMVCKDEENGRWVLSRANEFNDDIINESKTWGYHRMFKEGCTCKTLKECLFEIEHDLKYGWWLDDYQKSLRDEYID